MLQTATSLNNFLSFWAFGMLKKQKSKQNTATKPLNVLNRNKIFASYIFEGESFSEIGNSAIGH